MKSSLFRIRGALVAMVVFAAVPTFGATCESLATLKLADTTITSAEPVAGGAFVPAGGKAGMPMFKDVPAFCRVTAGLNPPAIPISRSKCGCQRQVGTASIRDKGTAGSPEPSTIRGWQAR